LTDILPVFSRWHSNARIDGSAPVRLKRGVQFLVQLNEGGDVIEEQLAIRAHELNHLRVTQAIISFFHGWLFLGFVVRICRLFR
jgi:hypothetical protein